MAHLCEISANSRGEIPAIFDIDPANAQLPSAAVDEITSGTGPKSKVMMLGPQGGLAVGIEIGRAHLSVGVGDPNGCLLGNPDVCEEEHSIDGMSAQKTFAKAARLVKKHLEACDVNPSDVRGVGVSIPGPVSLEGRTLARNISSSFFELDIPAKLGEKLLKVVGITADVFVENDVDVLARGEQRYGKGYGRRDFMVVKYSGGIGAGIVSDERLVRGRGGGGAGEIGHCRVHPHSLESDVATLRDVKEPQCKCKGFSHLEAFAGGDAIVERIIALEGVQAQLNLDASLPTQLAEAMALAHRGTEPHQQVIIDAAAMVGYAINSLVHLFNPEKVLICGKLSEMGASVLDAIRDECQAQGLLFGDAEQIVELGGGHTEEERRRISVGGAVTTALRKAPARFAYS